MMKHPRNVLFLAVGCLLVIPGFGAQLGGDLKGLERKDKPEAKLAPPPRPEKKYCCVDDLGYCFVTNAPCGDYETQVDCDVPECSDSVRGDTAD